MATNGQVGSVGTFPATLRAEVRKGKRGAARKVALIAPLPFCLLGVLASGVIPGMGAVGGISTVMWNYWYALMLPIATALMCVSVANLDARQKLRPVLGLPLPPVRTWWAKVCCGLGLVVAANVVVLAVSCVLTMLGAKGPNVFEGVATVLVLTIGSAWMIPTGLVLTMRFGTLVGIAIPALLQLGVGIALWSSASWYLFPSATALCAAAPFTRTEPSGVPLEPGAALGVFGWECWAGLAIAAALFAMLAVAGAAWFARREAK
ncbi:hypothetical protein [Gordonibacter sp.]|uniref:hypothetical protein n=1 Tax=Gordonibacter sp. TaxID=1968902 RepID=UPI001F940264|nr:hypothetical protein [Gordonibacter sp.]HIW77318.1 hypothetical protein [Candidatus Gordonibacter avicola]